MDVRPATRRRWLVAGLFLLASVAPLRGEEPTGSLPRPPQPPSALPWAEVEYRTHKLFLSATTTATLRRTAPAAVADVLRAAPSGSPLPLPDDGLALLTVTSSLPFGRHEVMRLVFDPATGTAFGSEKVTTGRRNHRSLARYLKEGVYTWSWTPADTIEEHGDPARWTGHHERFVPYPRELPPDGVVTDAYALLVLTTSMRPSSALPRRPLFVLSYHGFIALDVTSGGTDARRVDVEEERPSGRTRRTGRDHLAVLRVATRAVPANPAATPHDLGVLGFQGGVTLLVDPATGVTLAFTGRADYVGAVTSELARIRLEPPA